ncbi:DUF378 domain-containing protein [Candidatus Woesearchaeota archaeon]|nr:DUF378 domain-containing protein [Candidatus Woesearchaeota archaeon]
MQLKKVYKRFAYFLVLFGGLNLGFKGLFKADLISSLFVSFPLIARAIYVVIGIATLFLMYESFIVKKK